MDRKELLQLMRSSNADRDFLEELQEKLRAELNKPVAEQNFDLIEELNEVIDLMTGTDQIIRQRAEVGIARLKQQNQPDKRIRSTKKLRFIIPCACALVLVLTNLWSFSALGMNAFSGAYRLLNGGVLIDLQGDSTSSEYPKQQFANEMRSICEEYGFSPLTPAYIPEYMKPTEIFDIAINNDSERVCLFYFKHKKIKLNFQISYYLNTNEIPPLGIPTDTYHIVEEYFSGTKVYIMTEDEQFTAAFLIDNIEYLIAADGLDYDECRKVLSSMFE